MHYDIKETICLNTKRIREKAGLTKKEVTNRANINYSHYCRMENNKAELRFTKVLSIAESLGVNWEELWQD